MKKFITILCIVSLLASSFTVAFACDICQEEVEKKSEKIYVTRGISVSKNNTEDGKDSTLLTVRNQGTYPDSKNYNFTVIEVNASSVTDIDKIKNVSLHLFTGATTSNPIYIAAYALYDNFTYPKDSDNLGATYSPTTFGDTVPFKERFCSHENCLGEVDSANDQEFCSNILLIPAKTAQHSKVELKVTDVVKNELKNGKKTLYIGLGAPFYISTTDAKDEYNTKYGTTNGTCTFSFRAPSYSSEKYHPYIEIEYYTEEELAELENASNQATTIGSTAQYSDGEFNYVFSKFALGNLAEVSDLGISVGDSWFSIVKDGDKTQLNQSIQYKCFGIGIKDTGKKLGESYTAIPQVKLTNGYVASGNAETITQ